MTKTSNKEQETQKEELEDLFMITDNRQEKLKEIITNAVSSAVTILTKRINDLESKNEELTTKIKELSDLLNSHNIQEDIKQTTEQSVGSESGRQNQRNYKGHLPKNPTGESNN